MAADVVTDWTDPDAKKLGAKLTRAHIEDLTGRIDEAIQTANARMREMQQEINSLNALLVNLGDGRKRLEPILQSVQYLESIEQALKVAHPAHPAKKANKS